MVASGLKSVRLGGVGLEALVLVAPGLESVLVAVVSWWQCALWCRVQQLLFGGSCVQLCQLIWFGGIIGFVIRVCWCWALPLPV